MRSETWDAALRVRPATPNAAVRRSLAAHSRLARRRVGAERETGRVRQLKVTRSTASSNGLEARADGLLRVAVPPALADECASRVTQDAVQHQRARAMDTVVMEDLQRLPVGSH